MLESYLINHTTEIVFAIIVLISVIVGVCIYVYKQHKGTKVNGNRINYNTRESGEYHGFYAYNSVEKSRKSDSQSNYSDSNSKDSNSSSSHSNSTSSYSDSGSSCDSGSSSSSCE